ncbi:Kinesin-like protein KIF21A [Papilio xuthus]|uniref:Kinesin-like protein KIF21A n=1 Tax=Papilio xuthus TaxID=66420 RepID=A0A194PVG0_PAPXU|nr:Kinesin-like protein KIF21A [Papilio xuthus]
MGSGWEGEGDGDETRRGIIPRAIRDLFAGAEQRAEAARAQGELPPEFSVQAQFIELYNEDIVDLLDPAKDPFAKGALRITEDGCGGVKVVGASMRAVRGVRDALGALHAGALARTTAATNMNSSSSRSHAVFTLLLRQRRLATDQDTVDKEAEADAPEQYETLTAKFHFVDLAGSERLKRTGATGERAREGISINCGLLALGNVISALGDKSRKVLHVPYRDSKLTRLLQDSLGGNSNTVMIACVSPSDRDFMETLNTLKYANRARNIKNRCVVNQDLTSRTIHQLRQEVARLQVEIAEYKQGKRVVSENGEEGWSDVVQENAILTSEVESLRRRVKAMQGTIEQLSARNSELVAEKALGTWAPRDVSPDATDCSLTTLVQGYVTEIEDLRAQLMEATALYEASRKREARTRHDSQQDPNSILDDAKRELYKEKELLARSMGELEFQRKLATQVSESGEGREAAAEGEGEGEENGQPIGERERAEGESAGDSEPSDHDDDDRSDDERDEEIEAETAGQRMLTMQLAALSEDIDTKARLIEQLEASQRRLAALRAHYEHRLDTLHHQIKATGEERDKVLATLAAQASPPSEKLKRVKEEYERRVSGMARELRRLQAAQREHARLQRAQAATAHQIHALRNDLLNLKRDKVKLVQRMRTEVKRHAQAEAARAKEVAQLRKESRKNANLIRSLEAETRLKEQVLKRKQEEVSLLRRGHRDKLSSKAAGRLHDGSRGRSRISSREAWARIECWVSRASAARATLAELEATLEAQLRQRDRAAADPAGPDATALLAYLREAIADTQHQIMQIEEENEETELCRVLEQVTSAEAGRYALQRLAALALTHAHDAARTLRMLRDTRAQLAEMEEKNDRLTNALKSSNTNGDHNLNPWGVPPPALAALLAHVSSGTSTRSVSPSDSALLERPPVSGARESSTAPASPPDDNSNSPFQRNTARRGSVRLRDLGVIGRDEDPMSQSMVEHTPPRPAPLSRVPSAPGSLRGLTPMNSAPLSSPLTSRRPPPESPRPLRRQHSLAKPASLETSACAGAGPGALATPPASPGAARRARDDDVFLRLAGAAHDNSPQGVVRELPLKQRVSIGAGGGGGSGAWLQCTHVAEGHVGAALCLAATHSLLYSGGVDRTVRGWDLTAGREAWRGGCGAAVAALAAPGLLLAAAGPAVRAFDTRLGTPVATLWSSGGVGPTGAATSTRGETAVTALAAADAHRLYTAAGDRLRLWDLRMMECVSKWWSGHAAAVMCLAAARAGRGDRLATGSRDHCVRLLDLAPNDTGSWEISTRRLLEPPHYDGVQALLLAGEHLYSASRDSGLKCWSLADGTLAHEDEDCVIGKVVSLTCECVAAAAKCVPGGSSTTSDQVLTQTYRPTDR